MSKSTHLRLATAALLLASIASAQTPAPATLTGTLNIIGTDTMKDLMARWIAAFTAAHPAVHIQLDATGAMTAAPALAAGKADLAPLGREFIPSELANFRALHAYDPTAIPVAMGSYDTSGRTVALAFFVNAANPIAQLNFQQLDAVLCTSLRRGAPAPITTWGQLGVTGPLASQTIHIVGVNFPDGLSNYIRLRVCNDGTFRPGIREEHTGGPINVLERITTDVAADPAAIGYAGFANRKPGVRVVPVSVASEPPLLGTREEVASARYPLARTIYIYVDRDPAKPLSPLKQAFLDYVTSPAGQALVAADHIFTPVPPGIAKATY